MEILVEDTSLKLSSETCISKTSDVGCSAVHNGNWSLFCCNGMAWCHVRYIGQSCLFCFRFVWIEKFWCLVQFSHHGKSCGLLIFSRLISTLLALFMIMRQRSRLTCITTTVVHQGCQRRCFLML